MYIYVFLEDYPLFVEISTFRGYYLHFVEICTFRGYYPNFVYISVLRRQYVDRLRGQRTKDRPYRTYKYIRNRKYDKLIFSVML